MYDFLGYYQICYLGDEVADARADDPASILISVVAVAAIYLTMNVSILGVLPWREVIASQHVASDLMLRLYGPRGGAAGHADDHLDGARPRPSRRLLGYSRVPYAAARAGHFFRGAGRTHPPGDFPHRSLLLIGGLATLACLADLETVITALLTSRILIQFVGQIATVFYLRRRPDLLAAAAVPHAALPPARPWSPWRAGSTSSGPRRGRVIAYGLGSLLLGGAVFAVWDRMAATAESRLAHPGAAG